jgi:hypothetical protein
MILIGVVLNINKMNVIKITEQTKKEIISLHTTKTCNRCKKELVEKEIKSMSKLFNFQLNESLLKNLLLEGEDYKVIAPTLSNEDKQFYTLIVSDANGIGTKIYTTILETLNNNKIFFTIDNKYIAQILLIAFIKQNSEPGTTKLKKWDKNSENLLGEAQNFVIDSFSNLSGKELKAVFTEKDPTKINSNYSAQGNNLTSEKCGTPVSLYELLRLVNTHNLFNNTLVNPNGSGQIFGEPTLYSNKDKENANCLYMDVSDSTSYIFFGLKNIKFGEASSNTSNNLPFDVKFNGEYFEFVAQGVGIQNNVTNDKAKLDEVINFIKKVSDFADIQDVTVFSTSSSSEKNETPYKTEDEYYDVLSNFPDLDPNTTKNKQYPLPQYFSASSANNTVITDKNHKNSYNGFFSYKRAFNTYLAFYNKAQINSYNGFISDSYPVGSLIVRIKCTITGTGQKDIASFKSAYKQLNTTTTESINTFEYYEI